MEGKFMLALRLGEVEFKTNRRGESEKEFIAKPQDQVKSNSNSEEIILSFHFKSR